MSNSASEFLIPRENIVIEPLAKEITGVDSVNIEGVKIVPDAES